MIFDDITITNFGLYAGRQSIALTPLPGKPITLFGGLNGGGKTTLLDAIQLCLFGPHAKTSGRGRLRYTEYLSRCIHDKAKSRAAGVQISFRHTVAGNEDRYVLRRTWRQATKCTEDFDVLKNDRLAPTLAENWTTHVEDLLPANIAHLFLFDGEQIERYASPSDSASLIGTAIQNLLGLDLVDQLGKDITVYERRRRREQLDNATRAKVAGAEEELRALRSRIERLKQHRASLKTHQIDRRRREKVAIDDEFRRVGGGLFERRRTIEKNLMDAREELRSSVETLRDLACGPLPIALVRHLLDSAAQRDRDEQKIRRARQMHDLLAHRDGAVLKHLRDHGTDDVTCDRLRHFLEMDRSRYRKEAAGATVLDLTPEMRSELSSLRGQVEDLLAVVDGRLSTHSEVKESAEQAQATHDNIPAADALSEIVGKRDGLGAELARLEAEDRTMAGELERLQREEQRKTQALVRFLEEDLKERELRDDRERVLRCAGDVRKTLGAFRDAMVERHVSRVEHLVLDSYQHLLRKTSLVTRVKIDSKSFAITLVGGAGQVMRAEELSAGERQLLGIALLWGLAKASGRPLPIAIDTPLGRLDTGHRRHFVDRYLPFASHQTLLFSTDEEIVGEYLRRLKPWVGRSYHLSYNDVDGHTTVKTGYFEEEGHDGD